MSVIFEAELDAYEAEAVRRIGPVAAREARTELASHLSADYHARLELDVLPEEARIQSLAALGDLRSAARAERREPRDVSLFLAAPIALIGWCLGMAGETFWPAAIRETSIALQFAVLLGPSALVALYAGLSRAWPRWQSFLTGWAVAFGVSTPVCILFVFSKLSFGDAIEGMLAWGTGLALPGIVGLVFGIVIGRIARMPVNGAKAQVLGAMRYLAPASSMMLMLLEISLQTSSFSMVRWIDVPLILIGMHDRCRIDPKAIGVGLPLALLVFAAWNLMPHQGYVTTAQFLPLQLLMLGGLGLVRLLVLQAIGLGLWALSRQIPKFRRTP